MNSPTNHFAAKTKKKKIYFGEFNIVHDNAAYLPLVSGCLHAYILKVPELAEGYEVAPYLFKRDAPNNILSQVEDPDVAAFSILSWSERLSLHVAEEIKRKYPNCLIVVGGGSVPHNPTEYMNKYPFLDVCVRGEGEQPFADILLRNLEGRDFSNIPQVTFRDGDKVKMNMGEYPFEKDMDHLPSPYIGGMFDQLLKDNPQFNFQAILETNRGCPFKCTFCYWGKGDIGRRFKYHSLERVKKEIDWLGQNKIEYVFGADSNFGMHRRDLEIAQALAEAKKKMGYPKRFRTCYGKNTDENIYNVGKLLFDNELDKGVNLSRQSNDKQTLANIKRGNIKMETYRNLQTKFSEAAIPTWTEMIIGLPGETYETFLEGVEDVLNSDLKTLYLYWLEVFPNTDMADPEYQEKFGMKLVTSDIKPVHCSVGDREEIMEKTEIVIETKSMPHLQWRRIWKFAWLLMSFQSLSANSFVLHFLRRHLDFPYTALTDFLVDEAPKLLPDSMIAQEMKYYDWRLDNIVKGAGWGVEEPGYGDFYWFTEGCTFFHFAKDKDRFFREMEILLNHFLESRAVRVDPDLVSEVVRYQWLRMPEAEEPAVQQWQFQYNIPEYMESILAGAPVELTERSQVLYVHPIDYKGNLHDFAMDRTVWGRKNDNVLWKVTWVPIEQAQHEGIGGMLAAQAGSTKEGVGVW